MSSYREFEGKNVESAINNACEELNISEESLEHEVVSYGSTGIFGLVGTKKARIRVFLREERFGEDSFERKDGLIDSTAVVDVQTADSQEDIAAYGEAVLQTILDCITPDTTVSVENKKEGVFYRVQGGNSAILIGKRGQTLDAIQYIVEKIINKKSGVRIRIQIDIEGYLENRKVGLQELAARLASKVKHTGKPVTVGHMTAHDRRIVHLTLKNDNTVRTQSLGDGFLRKLVIFPRRHRNQSRNKKAVQP